MARTALFVLAALPLQLAVAVYSDEEAMPDFFLKFHTRLWIMGRPEMPTPPELEGVCERWTTLRMTTTEIEDPHTGQKVVTRGWNGMVPGPTVRMHPGCVWNLTIVNELGPPNPNCTVTNMQTNQPMYTNGSYCYLNTTNIHTHGLHTSPNEPGDDIFMRLKPGKSMNWTIEIPENHMGGTHWYHPHVHHATASQSGGGAAGALIVEDPEGAVPEYVAKMEEKLLIFLAVDFQLQNSIERMGMGALWQTSSQSRLLLVNGVNQPKVTIRPGKWHRFRMIYSAIEMMLQMTNRGSAWCSTQLLSKDGVWLDVAPRDLRGNWSNNFKMTPIQLGPANRADIAISCVCPNPWLGCYTEFYSLQNCTDEAISINESDGEVLEYNEGFYNQTHGLPITPGKGPPPNYQPCNPTAVGDPTTASRRRRGCEGIPKSPMIEAWGPLEPPRCGFGRRSGGTGKVVNGPGLGDPKEDDFYGAKMHKLSHGLLDAFNGTIFSIVVKPTKSPFRRWWHPAWKFSVRRPCYLVDTRRATVPTENQRHVEFYGAVYPEPALLSNPGPIAMMWNTLGRDIPPNPDGIVPPGNVKFEDPPIPAPYGNPLPVGSISEWYVGGMAFHPFHLHITPFQILEINGTQDLWLQPGDWQDTLLSRMSNCNNSGLPCPSTDQQIRPEGAPRAGFAGMTVVRFWTDVFTGRYVSHCHLLTHEDEGMMFYVNVSGTEGTRSTQAREIDPTCYDGHLRDVPGNWGFRWRWADSKKGGSPQLVQKRRRLRSTRHHMQPSEDADESAYLQGEVQRFDGEDLEDFEEGDEEEEYPGQDEL